MTFIASPQSSDGAPTAPDWQAIRHEVKCPLCEYNLRGLQEPRCPECGYQFDWRTVADPADQRHPYLFEHHPERNLRSFFQTLLHQMRPKRFWGTLDPTHRFRLGRIFLYWSICALFTLLPAVTAWEEEVRFIRPWIRPGRSFLGYVNAVRHIVFSPGGLACATAVLLLALFPWLNFLSLMIFQQSMRRARVKASHVVRCALYSGDVIFWWGLATTLSIIAFGPNSTVRTPGELPLLLLLPGALFVSVLLNFVRLWTAYARYLRFKGALATVIASQMIVGLTIFTLVMCVATY